MTTTFVPASSEPMLLDPRLESAVVINWGDLVRSAIPEFREWLSDRRFQRFAPGDHEPSRRVSPQPDVNTNNLVQVGPPSVDVVALARTNIDRIAGSQQ